MLGETMGLRATFLMTYFIAQFGFRICKETLIDSYCISSLSIFNFVVTLLSWIILSLLKKSSRLSTSPPVPFHAKIITAFLQSLHFIFLTKSISVNTFSVHRFALLLAIPFGLFISYFFLKRKISSSSMVSISIFLVGACMISTDSFSISSFGLSVGLLYALFNSVLSVYIENVIIESGSSSINLQESVAGFRLLFLALFAFFDLISQPKYSISFQLDFYPLCLILVASALDLALTVSMISLISATSSISFLVAEQFCELFMILIGHTLNPTHFTTIQEAVSSFLGFALALPGQALFVVVGDTTDSRPTDIEPFRPLSPADSSNPPADTDNLIE
ncbi:hypothetical protein TRFO_03258 [Tritrichomonas foetus]|uniref:EamA domain-containing protein n=1 Tax=Tritrichomonas foetus TaxID=1144522 RepID=A0A1J4KRG9_9EUKA|nr:hypothetical protein TRFO_03258 [Tritrichomonas foetus]|eukprot:OHT13528.1 hypothetical protein TRFO_03258 [Tritrichomonas foetus]